MRPLVVLFTWILVAHLSSPYWVCEQFFTNPNFSFFSFFLLERAKMVWRLTKLLAVSKSLGPTSLSKRKRTLSCNSLASCGIHFHGSWKPPLSFRLHWRTVKANRQITLISLVSSSCCLQTPSLVFTKKDKPATPSRHSWSRLLPSVRSSATVNGRLWRLHILFLVISSPSSWVMSFLPMVAWLR